MECVEDLKAGWKANYNEEACYIEIDDDEHDEGCVVDENKTISNWNDLPDLLLEEIFMYLNIRERFYASLTCKSWHRAFYLKRVWSNFRVVDDTLFNFYSGWPQMCLTRVGRFIKGLEIELTQNVNIQFMTLLCTNIQQSRKPKCELKYYEVGKRITSFRFKFSSSVATRDSVDDVRVLGQFFMTLKSLLNELKALKTLKLIDLMLERFEAKHLLDEVLESSKITLKSLSLINVTKTHTPISHAGLFNNLKVLIISPQNLDDEILQLLSSSALENLHIFQNSFGPPTPAACSAKAWKKLCIDNLKIKVHLRIESSNDEDITFQPNAPVYSITYRGPKNRIKLEKMLAIVDLYRFTLTSFGHEMLPEFSSSDSFNNRIDSLLLLMASECPNLTSFSIREKVSTATLLLLAKTAINLRFFNVRRNAIVQKCDWPKNPEWTDGFFEWLQISSRSYDSTEKEISQILGYRWTMLCDKSYQEIKIHLSGFSV